MKPVTPKQQRLCRKYPELVPYIGLGAKFSISQCQYQFKNRKWNCSAHSPENVFGKIVKIGEFIFVFFPWFLLYFLILAFLIYDTKYAIHLNVKHDYVLYLNSCFRFVQRFLLLQAKMSSYNSFLGRRVKLRFSFSRGFTQAIYESSLTVFLHLCLKWRKRLVKCLIRFSTR